jgi:hypothetical protein
VVRDHQLRELIKVGWVKGQHQLADVLTKADFIKAVTAVMGEGVQVQPKF